MNIKESLRRLNPVEPARRSEPLTARARAELRQIVPADVANAASTTTSHAVTPALTSPARQSFWQGWGGRLVPIAAAVLLVTGLAVFLPMGSRSASADIVHGEIVAVDGDGWGSNATVRVDIVRADGTPAYWFLRLWTKTDLTGWVEAGEELEFTRQSDGTYLLQNGVLPFPVSLSYDLDPQGPDDPGWDIYEAVCLASSVTQADVSLGMGGDMDGGVTFYLGAGEGDLLPVTTFVASLTSSGLFTIETVGSDPAALEASVTGFTLGADGAWTATPEGIGADEVPDAATLEAFNAEAAAGAEVDGESAAGGGISFSMTSAMDESLVHDGDAACSAADLGAALEAAGYSVTYEYEAVPGLPEGQVVGFTGDSGSGDYVVISSLG